MERIKLSEKGKMILNAIHNNNGSEKQYLKEYDEIQTLIFYDLVSGDELMDNSFWDIQLTPKGEEYFRLNPNLKNPSIWDDKKYIITTIISSLALILSLIAIFKK